MLPESLIWIDYACMPQPSAEDTPAAPAAGSKAKVQDHRLLKGTSESKQRVIEQLTLAVSVHLIFIVTSVIYNRENPVGFTPI